jgi:hypothetical protein
MYWLEYINGIAGMVERNTFVISATISHLHILEGRLQSLELLCL